MGERTLLQPNAMNNPSYYNIKAKLPVETKIFSFKTNKTDKGDALIKTSDYFSSKEPTSY